MRLPVLPPVAPMLARLARDLPLGDDWLYEPKWDGFRCLVFRDGDEVELTSRNRRPLTRYFPEVVEGARADLPERCVVDGELVVGEGEGADFAALMLRLHPSASRVERLSRETPARLVVFDLLALDDDDLRAEPFAARRRMLERALVSARPPVLLTPATADAAAATAWLDQPRRGVDGVVAKRRDLRYEPGRRSMVKVKHERTAECVVAGFRWLADAPLVGALLLGLHDGDGTLRHVGVASSFSRQRASQLLDELEPLVVPLEGHPWAHGFALAPSPLGRLKGAAGVWTPALERDWVPLRPCVAEVAYDHVDGDRFRHPTRFRRWRPDREPPSCTFDQFESPPPVVGRDR